VSNWIENQPDLVLVVRCETLRNLQQQTLHLHNSLRTADLGSVSYVRRASRLLSAIFDTAYQVAASGTVQPDDTYGQKLAQHVFDQARDLKALLRHTALKFAQSNEPVAAAQERLVVASLVLNQAVQELRKYVETSNWTDSAVRDLSHEIG